ncbi:hypothetical protein [Methanosarcina sp. UBA5]|uniref:hypothetical protein n=1 Tax=Methanosarcina sp. UBA5 TaxID=1915593 RepID=UPI0025CBF491|nr:hypothetical protein [Methanosarcina sp. UBA5]
MQNREERLINLNWRRISELSGKARLSDQERTELITRTNLQNRYAGSFDGDFCTDYKKLEEVLSIIEGCRRPLTV